MIEIEKLKRGRKLRKKIAIATFYINSMEFYSKQIKRLFGDRIEVKSYCFQDRSIEQGIVADLVLISSFGTFEAVKRHVKNNAEIIVARRTISKEGFDKINSLPEGTKAILANVSGEMAIETISLIYQLGVKHVELTPVYLGNEETIDIDTAITPGEISCVPNYVKKMINIGDRVLDISTIMDIAIKLELEHLLDDEEFNKYFDEIIPESLGIERMVGKTNRLESQFDILLQVIDEGIIAVNSDGIIHSCNESAIKILDLNRERVIGKDATQLFPKIPFSKVLRSSAIIKENLIKISELDVVVSVVPIIDSTTIYGAVAILRKFSDTEKKQNRLRAQLIGKGHKAKYSFDNILGDSTRIDQTKKIARRMSKSNSSVLIIGESGTGKELFAQAIHNDSPRKNHQFVAVNCAALPESLLESELFGYEEGAFTGARKGGKPGLFELAHMGTLFLDEIGEMPLKLQARLLRVLQEKEVMRIGGDTVINVDIRIIAATNRNIEKLVSVGEFREDLYFRLNVLPLRIPPLRERCDDIELLINQFMNEFNSKFKLSHLAKEAFLNHRWHGNIRELRNYIEYLTNLGEKVVEIKHLPFYCSNKIIENKTISEEEQLLIKKFRETLDKDEIIYIFILEELEKSYMERKHIGRRSLEKLAEEKQLFLTEQEIRRILLKLKNYSMVEILKGRGGTKITELGRKTLRILKKG